MTLQQTIFDNIKNPYFIKVDKDILKLIKSDIQREKHKDVPDNVVLRIINEHISGVKEMLTYIDKKEDEEKYKENKHIIDVLSVYLPQMASEGEIKDYIDNMDMSKFKNKIEAMKPIMKYFGSTANGSDVKKILMGV